MPSPLEKRCYESNHMHPREFGLLTVLQRITKGCKTTLFFDGPTIATWFTGVSKTAIYDSTDKLVREGWLIPLNGTGRKRKAGSKRFEATQYRVLNHEQWIKEHSKGQCNPFRKEGMESIPESGNGPFRKSSRAIPEIQKSHSGTREEALYNPCFVKTNFVKACSVKGATPDSLDLDQGQNRSGVATLSKASIPEVGNGDHTVPEPPVLIDWDAIQAKAEAEERERGAKL
jgi:hypothetical protein